MSRFWFILIATVALAALIVEAPTYVRQDLLWIDAISGSQRSQMVWRIGNSAPAVVSDSLLAKRYRKLGLQWKPDWRNVRGTYLDLLGRNVGHAHGSAPEIYTFALHPDAQQSYLAASSDAEVREFFRIMSSGTEAEKRAAVEAAEVKALSNWPGTRPAG